jgi:murein L,D-transpeptidase YcbB/YkuD
MPATTLAAGTLAAGTLAAGTLALGLLLPAAASAATGPQLWARLLRAADDRRGEGVPANLRPHRRRHGPLTTAAVKRFHRAQGLKVDGTWGPRSAAAARRRLA